MASKKKSAKRLRPGALARMLRKEQRERDEQQPKFAPTTDLAKQLKVRKKRQPKFAPKTNLAEVLAGRASELKENPPPKDQKKAEK